jgi:hypothetical protein
LWIIDHGFWDGLRDDPLHDLLNHALLGQPSLGVGVIRLDLVAQVPVAEQAHFWRERTLSLIVQEVVHPYVVLRDV